MMILTPGQEMKFRRLQSEAKAFHRQVLAFGERRREVMARLIDVDKQVAIEESRGKAFPADMRAEINALKEPLKQELALLAREEERVTAEYRQRAQLTQSLERYVKRLGRSN